jgi:hypothetical protein
VTGLGDAAAAVATVGAAFVMVTVDEELFTAYAVACTAAVPAATGAVYNPVAALTYPMPLASDQKKTGSGDIVLENWSRPVAMKDFVPFSFNDADVGEIVIEVSV